VRDYTPPALHALRQIGRAALVALALGTALGCQPKVGDPCKRALDCGLRVIRQCDVSNAQRDPKGEGECIVENCSYGVCPKEAVCVKVYASEFLSVSCDPEREDLPMSSDGETVVQDDCAPNEVCLPEGLCAAEIRARTSCRLECDDDRDCRSNYQCVSTGIGGLYVAPDPEDPTIQRTAKICVPR
jgi:hypothetical protein